MVLNHWPVDVRGMANVRHLPFRHSSADAASRNPELVKPRFKQPRGRPTYIQAWRKYRGLTQEQLAERIGRSTATVSQLENRKQDYTQATLEAIAYALQCEPADLLTRNPEDTASIWTLWEQAKPAQRRQIIGLVEGFLRASGDD